MANPFQIQCEAGEKSARMHRRQTGNHDIPFAGRDRQSESHDIRVVVNVRPSGAREERGMRAWDLGWPVC